MTYLIEWNTGATQVIKGTNYINALYVNHIDEELECSIVSHKLLKTSTFQDTL